jgi:hypothetical protein
LQATRLTPEGKRREKPENRNCQTLWEKWKRHLEKLDLCQWLWAKDVIGLRRRAPEAHVRHFYSIMRQFVLPDKVTNKLQSYMFHKEI